MIVLYHEVHVTIDLVCEDCWYDDGDEQVFCLDGQVVGFEQVDVVGDGLYDECGECDVQCVDCWYDDGDEQVFCLDGQVVGFEQVDVVGDGSYDERGECDVQCGVDGQWQGVLEV